jgi:putative ATP-binding cassette transporter
MSAIRDIVKVFSFLLRQSREVRFSRGLIALIIAVGIVGGIASTALIAVVNSVISGARSHSEQLLWAFAALCVILPLSRFSSALMLNRLTSKSNRDLRMRLARRILASPLRNLEEMGIHRLQAVLTVDIPTIGMMLPFIPGLCVNIVIFFTCIFYLAWLSWSMLLALIGFMAVGIITYQLPLIKGMHYFRLLRKEADSLASHYRGLVEGVKELKLHSRRREAFFTELLEPTTRVMERYGVAGNLVTAAAVSWGQVLVFLLIGLLIFGIPSFSSINTEVLTGYTMTILYMVGPLEAALNTFPALGRAGVAIENVQRLGLSLDKLPDEKPSRSNESNPGWQSLELAGVTHTYYREKEEENFTLGPIDLTFRPGEMIFLTGGNGSGKTTLAKLITCLYTPESGEIRFNGEPVTNENIEAYRQNFSMVFYDFHLFEKLLGLNEPGMDDLAQEYLAKLQLDHKVKVRDGGLSTTELSAGQRKRLALLTAFLEDRNIYIFDEWASDQDPIFRDVFYYEILPELKARGKLVLVISHDDRYYLLGDRILKLDYGKIEYDQKRDLAAGAPASIAVPAE